MIIQYSMSRDVHLSQKPSVHYCAAMLPLEVYWDILASREEW